MGKEGRLRAFLYVSAKDPPHARYHFMVRTLGLLSPHKEGAMFYCWSCGKQLDGRAAGHVRCPSCRARWGRLHGAGAGRTSRTVSFKGLAPRQAAKIDQLEAEARAEDQVLDHGFQLVR